MNGHFAVRFTDKLATAPARRDGSPAIIRENENSYRDKIFWCKATRNKNPDTLLLPFISYWSPVTIALLERFGNQGSDGLSYTRLFREKNCAKHVEKYQLFQTAMPHILMSTIKDFLKILSASGPNSAFSTGALNQLLKLWNYQNIS
jgi:hypothetical protein